MRSALLALALFCPASALAQTASFTVTNQSAWVIHRLFVSSSNVDEWGPDQLGEEVITTGESYTLHSIPCDTYDMRIVDEDGDECVMKRIPMCGNSASYTITSDSLVACINNGTSQSSSGGGTFQPTHPSSPSNPIIPGANSSTITVQNYSSWSIHRLYLSPTSVSTWGDDRLGEGTIPASGGSTTLSGIACDNYDVKLVDEDGDECVMKNVRLCGASQTWTITSDNLLACQAGN